jgi:HEAT repeat protein
MNNNDSHKTLLEHLLNVLQNPASSAGIVYDAAQDLKTMGDEKAIKPLTNRLSQELDPSWVRRELVIALCSVILLSGLDSPEARDLLLGILSSSDDDEVKAAAALGLGCIGEIRAVEHLLEILESGNDDLMYACAAALGDIGDSRAIDPLIELLKIDRLAIPQTAAEGLGKIGAEAKRALPTLEELAERGNEAERRYALEAIARIEQDLKLKEDL